MRKRVIIAFVVSLFAFTSCFKSDIDIPPTHSGVMMYQDAKLSNNYVMFCAELAFKLNVLLESRDGDQPLDEILLVSGTEKGKEIKSIGVDQLFKDIDISFKEMESGQWELTFVPNIPQNTYDGSLLISTNRKLLSEVGSNWDVTNSPNKDMSYGGGGIVMDESRGVNIAHLEQDRFWIYVSKFTLYNLLIDPEKKIKTEWALDFYVNKNSSDYTLLGLRNSLYEMVGDASGSVARYGTQLTYEYEIDDNVQAPSPLRYKYNAKLNRSILYEGTEIVNAPGLTILDPHQYPSSEVVIMWKSTIEGSVYYDLTYNGFTVTSLPNLEE